MIYNFTKSYKNLTLSFCKVVTYYYWGYIFYQIDHKSMRFQAIALVENYVQKHRNWNQLQFLWLAWFVVAKWLHICFFGLAIKF